MSIHCLLVCWNPLFRKSSLSIRLKNLSHLLLWMLSWSVMKCVQNKNVKSSIKVRKKSTKNFPTRNSSIILNSEINLDLIITIIPTNPPLKYSEIYPIPLGPEKCFSTFRRFLVLSKWTAWRLHREKLNWVVWMIYCQLWSLWREKLQLTISRLLLN